MPPDVYAAPPPSPPGPAECARLAAIFEAFWPADVANCAPLAFLAFDTTGLGKDDLVVSAAALVRDPTADEAEVFYQFVFGWPQDPGVDLAWLRGRLERTAAECAKLGVAYSPTWELLLGPEARPPAEAGRALTGLLADLGNRGGGLVAHSLWASRTMRSILTDSLDRAGTPLKARLAAALDLAAVEKAIQAGLAPWPGEVFRDWCDRVAAHASTVKFRLSGHCDRRYRLRERLEALAGVRLDGWPVPTRNCYMVAALYDAYRALVAAAAGKDIP
jgi:hypothetical protein